ncbi:MAG: hypothetical protein KKC46_18715 [Proteobacteria bacterium]|nr:hypothetical protein [Pseudomonadota bacterium]
MADYKWNSYLFYGYKKKGPDWLKSSIILDYLSASDPHKAYRKKMQEYAEEKQRLLQPLLFKKVFPTELITAPSY